MEHQMKNKKIKHFTVKQFQNSPTKCLKSGVCILTRYNIPVYRVEKLEGVTQQVTQHITKDSMTFLSGREKQPNVTQHVEQSSQVEENKVFGKCNAPSCRNTGELELATYKEWDGDIGEIRCAELMMCNKCVEKFERMQEL